MKLPPTHSAWVLSAIPAFALLVTPLAKAQNCNLPTVPDGTITSTQDRDQMMCQQHLTLLVLPPAVARSESSRGQRAHRMPQARPLQEGKT